MTMKSFTGGDHSAGTFTEQAVEFSFVKARFLPKDEFPEFE
jgi:hypothetical protein